MKKSKTKYTISSLQLFDAQKPQYNSFAFGHGSHKNKKAYNRRDKSWKNDGY